MDSKVSVDKIYKVCYIIRTAVWGCSPERFIGSLVQRSSTSACHAEDRGFESHRTRK